MNKKRQRGAAVIEFALVVPLLLVILFGIIEFGVLLYDKAMITNASREGARYGIVFDDGTPGRCDDNGNLTNSREAEIKAVVENYCADHLISFGGDPDLPINVEVPVCASGEPLTVELEYEFRFLLFSNLIGLVGGSMADHLKLTAVTVMRLE